MGKSIKRDYGYDDYEEERNTRKRKMSDRQRRQDKKIKNALRSGDYRALERYEEE